MSVGITATADILENLIAILRVQFRAIGCCGIERVKAKMKLFSRGNNKQNVIIIGASNLVAYESFNCISMLQCYNVTRYQYALVL